MLFGGRSASPTPTRYRTPQKTPTKSYIRKDTYRHDARTNNSAANPSLPNKQNKALKSKQNMGVLYALEEIYTQLKFIEFDTFPQERILDARRNIEKLYSYFKETETLCPKHQELLNLYCETEREVLCVSCVFNNPEHKNHKVRQIHTVEKVLESEIIRNEDKAKCLTDQLTTIQEEIREMEKEVCAYFMNINTNGVSIINDAIKELELMKEDYEHKISLAYRRTNTVLKKYQECLDLFLSILDGNLYKVSSMKGLNKYLVLKELIKETALVEELVSKYQENKVLMQPWKKAVRDLEKIIIKKKVDKPLKEDMYIVTKF